MTFSRTAGERMAVAVLCLALVPLAIITYNHTNEDAFITFRYVEQFAAGHGPVYNRGEIVEGFSNPLWVLLLTPASWLGVRLHVAARVLSILFLAILVVSGWKISEVSDQSDMSDTEQRRNCWRWWLPLAFAFQPFLNYHRDMGLETVSYAALLGVMLFAAGSRRWIVAGVAGALASVSRPEGLAFVIAAFPMAAWEFWRSRPILFDRRVFLREHGRHVLFFTIPLVTWLGAEFLRRVYYDGWVPNTVRAKSHGTDGWRPILLLLGSWWGFPVLGVVGSACVFFRDRRNILAMGCALQIAAAVAFQLKAGDIFQVGFRYMAPILVPSLVGAWLGVRELHSVSQNSLTRRSVAILGVVLLALNTLIPFSWDNPWVKGIQNDDPKMRLAPRLWQFARERDFKERLDWFLSDPIEIQAQVGRWISSTLVPAHPDAMLAADQMGMLGYYAPHNVHILDMLGLMDRHVATYNLTGVPLGEYIVERGAMFIVVMAWKQEPELPWIRPEDCGRAMVGPLRQTMEEPPIQEKFAPYYRLVPRNEAEPYQFIVYGPLHSAPDKPEVVLLGPTSEEFLKAWRVTSTAEHLARWRETHPTPVPES